MDNSLMHSLPLSISPSSLSLNCVFSLIYSYKSMEVERDSNSRVGMLVESSNLNNVMPYQQIKYSSCTSIGSSKFKGVLLLRSGKWGAQISYKYKPYWLGTFQVEEEAAMAYDRAAIKLQRSDAPLNFLWTNYTVQEIIFQSQHSSEEILGMIKSKTYSSNFSTFIAMLSSRMGSEAIGLVKRGISCQMLFQKELTQTDVAHIKGFHVPKEYALQCFPPLIDINSTEDQNKIKSMDLTFYDKHCHSWNFRYSYWKSTQSFVFARGWRYFLKMNNFLNPKDVVIFNRCEYKVNGRRRLFYMIDVLCNNAENHAVGGNAEQGIGINGSVSYGVDLNRMGEEERNDGVRLFGVQIS